MLRVKTNVILHNRYSKISRQQQMCHEREACDFSFCRLRRLYDVSMLVRKIQLGNVEKLTIASWSRRRKFSKTVSRGLLRKYD